MTANPRGGWGALADARVPRYTSYPTAPHFTAQVGPAEWKRWLGALDPGVSTSLYVHVPFCRKLCWYCGCNTAIVSRHRPIGAFVGDLLAEIDLVADALPGRLAAGHLHFGGGTPTALAPDEFRALRQRIAARFALAPDAEIAVEIDPRCLNGPMTDALVESGVNRASLGVQDFDPAVQQAINRVQPAALVAATVQRLRAAGIGRIGFDLIYGLPLQTVDSLCRTVDQVVAMRPDSVALFGYAHVPWMKPHQKLLERHRLPDAAERWAMAEATAACLRAHGYRRIGLDHFAQAGDPLAQAAARGTLRRNFQGYTTDDAAALIAFGPSGISRLPQGYAQSIADTAGWSRAIRARVPAVARGRAIDDDDRLRGAVIERLMCDMDVDLDALARAFGRDPTRCFAAERERLRDLSADGIVVLDGGRVRVCEAARPLVRSVAAVFDAYLAAGAARHAVAV